jgi:hypothetical protein
MTIGDIERPSADRIEAEETEKLSVNRCHTQPFRGCLVAVE